MPNGVWKYYDKSGHTWSKSTYHNGKYIEGDLW